MSKIRVVVPFSKVAWLTVSLPFLAFVFCVAWSVLYNFEHATSTHCQVRLLREALMTGLFVWIMAEISSVFLHNCIFYDKLLARGIPYFNVFLSVEKT